METPPQQQWLVYFWYFPDLWIGEENNGMWASLHVKHTGAKYTGGDGSSIASTKATHDAWKHRIQCNADIAESAEGGLQMDDCSSWPTQPSPIHRLKSSPLLVCPRDTLARHPLHAKLAEDKTSAPTVSHARVFFLPVAPAEQLSLRPDSI